MNSSPFNEISERAPGRACLDSDVRIEKMTTHTRE